MVSGASGRVLVEPSSVANADAAPQLSKPSLSGPSSAYRAGTSRQSTAVFLGLVATVRPSMAIASSTNSIPASAHSWASSSLILRLASLMSASPAQNFLKPSPVPGPSTVTARPPSDLVSASSLTSTEIGSTVDEPVTNTSPSGSAGPSGRADESEAVVSATAVVAAASVGVEAVEVLSSPQDAASIDRAMTPGTNSRGYFLFTFRFSLDRMEQPHRNLWRPDDVKPAPR